MASVLVLLFALFCGVYTASIPDSNASDNMQDSTLDDKLDSSLDGLDSQMSDDVKQIVLEGVKKLLDSQLAALVKDKDRKDREGNKRTSKTRSSSILTSKPKAKITQEFSSSEDIQNPKIVTEDSVQDRSVDALRNAVDELLKENKDIILEDKDEIILDNNVDNILDLENSTNNDNEGIISQDGYDQIASQLFKHTKKDRKANKSYNRKKSNRVIVNRLPKGERKKDDDIYKFEDNLDEKSKVYDENVKTQSNSDNEQMDSKKRLKYNKQRKNQIEQMIKKENEAEANQNPNTNLVSPTYKRGQKYGRPLYGRNKKNPNNYSRNGNRHIYYKLAKNPKPHTVNSNNDGRTFLYNDVVGKSLKQKSLQNEHSKFEKIQGKQKTKTNDNGDLIINKEKTKNNEETDIYIDNKNEIKDKMGKDKDSGNKDKTSVTEEKANITADKVNETKVNVYRTKNVGKENQIEPDEIIGEKGISQENEDSASTDTKDQANDLADKENNISENEKDITETENISSEKENVAREANDEKETDKDYILDFLENAQNTDADKKVTEDKHSKKEDMNVSKENISRNCRHEKKHESDESRLLRDLIRNNDIKKSFSISLNFTSQ